MRQSVPRATFIGRTRELADLHVALEDTLAGHGRLFLISGEPGIGKTRLAEELSNEARAHGVRVIWGRCWAGDGAAAYWPWIQVVRSCLNNDSSSIKNLLNSAAPQLAELLPEIRQAQRSTQLASIPCSHRILRQRGFSCSIRSLIC